MLYRCSADRKKYIFLYEEYRKKLVFGAIYSEESDVHKELMEYAHDAPAELTDTRIEEIPFNAIYSMLRTLEVHNVIDEAGEIYQTFDIDPVPSRRFHQLSTNEFVIGEIPNREALETKARSILAEQSLLAELDRIYYDRGTNKCLAHPVHYLIQEYDAENRKAIQDILLAALYANRRLQNRRFFVLEINERTALEQGALDLIYKQVRGGAVIIHWEAAIDEEEDRRTPTGDLLCKICDAVLKFRRDVLTIFSFESEGSKEKDRLFEFLNGMTLIELSTDVIYGKRARKYLRERAEAVSLEIDRKLYRHISNDGTGYRVMELKQWFEEWCDDKLKTTMFPQYATTPSIRESIRTSKDKGSAVEDLEKMIGLSEAKQIIQRALDYFKVQRLYGDFGLPSDHPSMHMVFTGNPGTAKTTVARLFAQIMRDNGVLSRGELYEVGRGDLVGKYVGWTAKIIQQKFKAARGSVLFIDEAYSLLDDRKNSYGDEAINTIVQEMENNRDSVVVIFAGYPDQMEDFLQRNPGLRSRIAFHVPFHDYNTDELCGIADLIAQEKGVHLTPDAMSKCREIFEAARKMPDFGNGRYVRNLIERAKLEQAGRIVKLNVSKVSAKALKTIEELDIVPPDNKLAEVRRIGFTASS